MREIPLMPEEYKGEITKGGGYTNTAPRKWTENEMRWLKELSEKGYSNKEIAVSLGRSEVSVSIKAKRLGKKRGTYNQRHVAEKYELNQQFLEIVKPKTCLDLYCGEKSFYKSLGYPTASNDIDEAIEADMHEDAFKCICGIYSTGWKYDLVDLDPFGSAYDCFDIAVKIARKALVITLGELGHKRWKRLDFVGTHYGIERVEDFTIDNLIKHIQMIGRRNKKKLAVWQQREWQNIGRVWFTIEPIKVTTQWDKSNKEVK